MADEKKLAGKYATPEEMEKAYLALEAKLGQQGTELGEMKKLVGQWQPWIEKASPIVEWYGKHADKVNDWVSKGMNTGAAQPAAAAADATARAAAANTAGYEWLTPQEKAGLVGEIRDTILKQTMQPWTEAFTQQAQKYATDATSRLDNQHKSFTDVLWQTLSRVIPKEKMDEVKAFHEASLRFADPSKIDPMKMGEEYMGLTGENASLKARLKEYEDKSLVAEKAQVQGIFGGPSPDTATPNDTAAPTTREERFKATMNATQAEHPDGLKQMFPSLV